jgi:CheY-like chemotaxis protein
VTSPSPDIPAAQSHAHDHAGVDDVASIVSRLERRAAREHAARLEAEAIAESELRRSYERAREVELLAAIAVVVNEASDLSEALSGSARALRRHCGFAVAHVLVPDDDADFVTSDIWDADGDQLQFLDAVMTATAELSFPLNVGLPGQVAGSHLALWLPDLSMAGDRQRRPPITAGAAWALPVVSGVDVVAVIEFLDPAPRPVDDRLLALAPSLAGQIAHAAEWDRLRRREVDDRARLEQLVATQAEALSVAQREGASVGAARLSLLAYLAHEVALCLTELDPVGTPALDATVRVRLDDASRRLLVAIYGSDRRVAGDRVRTSPEDLVLRALASVQGQVQGGSVSVRVTPGSDVMVEVNRDLVERALAGLIAPGQLDGTDGPLEVDVQASEGAVEFVVQRAGAQQDRTDDLVNSHPQVVRLVAALGGTVTVEQVETCRSQIRLCVPARTTSGVDTEVDGGALTRVLVVDDNTINRRLAAAMLDRIGLTADVVESGARALEQLRTTAYAVVLMDVQMPVLDGRETTRAWRTGTEPAATRRDVPIVALTAHVGEDERVACTLAGMDDYLSKPFGIDALSEVCRRWVDQGSDARA